ncbi:MAG: S8 family serine peptidase [Candidatus Thalassarchaeaceae archaeon]|jgi:serine protease AprX|nr:S8 family serine peptidase [Candidatus Thalassarchaeaceae archaeon]
MPRGPYEHLEYLPEPEEPQMLTAIDADAPGYPPEDYGATAEQAEEWRKMTAQNVRDDGPKPWGMLTVLVIISGMFLSYPSLVGFFADALTPDSKWAYENSEIYTLQDEYGLTGEGIRVCIVDTGIDIDHPDFEEVRLVRYKDFISNADGTIQDRGDDKHGTMMAGILVAQGKFTGAAPNVDLFVAAALDKNGQSSSEAVIANAINWCWRDVDAHIISLSLGGDPNPDNPLGSQTASAVSDALDHGVFVVAAAGNSGGPDSTVTDVSVPANVAGVIAVGSIDESGIFWEQTAEGSETDISGGELREYPNQKPEVSAPGVAIISTSDSSLTVPYSESTGTSDSTVFVVGALALILERHGDALTRNGMNADRDDIDLVKRALADSCDSDALQGQPHHSRYGYGTLNALTWERAVADEIAIRGDI